MAAPDPMAGGAPPAAPAAVASPEDGGADDAMDALTAAQADPALGPKLAAPWSSITLTRNADAGTVTIEIDGESGDMPLAPAGDDGGDAAPNPPAPPFGA